MRLARLAFADGVGAAVVRDGRAVAVSGYPDVGAILAASDAGIAAASAAVEAGEWQTFADEDLRSPIASPSAVFCVGLNYATHIREMGRELPEHPTLFSKLARTLTDPFATVLLPSVSDQVDYEGELVIVIGRRGRDIDPKGPKSISGGTAS